MGSILYDFLTESFLFSSEQIDSGFAGLSEDALLDELRRYRSFCLEHLPQLEAEVTASGSILRVFSGRLGVDFKVLKQSALYIEQYVIPDPLFPFSESTTHIAGTFRSHIGLPGRSAVDRGTLRKSLRFLKDITPFVAADYVKLLPVSLIFEPPEELPLYCSENRFEDVLPPDLLGFFSERCVTNSARRTDQGWAIEDTLSVARSIVTTFEGHHPYQAFGQFLLEQRIVSCDDKTGTFEAVQYLPETLPSEGEFRSWVRQSENRAAINFYNEVRTEVGIGARLGASYLTQSPFVSELLTRFFPRELESNTPEHTTNTVLNIEVPFLDSIKTETLMDIRRNDGEVFQNFRCELESRLFEVRLESDPERRRVKAEKAFHDLGLAQVRALDMKAKDLARSSAAQAVVAAATLVASVTTGLTLLAPVMAGAGLVKILYDYRANTRSNPAFFLWKATKR